MKTRSGFMRAELNSVIENRLVLGMKNKRTASVSKAKRSALTMPSKSVEKQNYPLYSVSYSANETNPHWCMEVQGVTWLPFLSCIDTMKLFSENYPEIRQIRREGFKFVFDTSIPANEDEVPPTNLRTRLQQFCINASHVAKVAHDPRVSQILWTR